MPDIQEFDTLEAAQAALAQTKVKSKKPYGRAVVEDLFPGVAVTSDYRPSNHPLSKKNPKSYHTLTDKAVDVKAIPGMDFNQFLDNINKAGYDILDYRDEYKDPSPWSTGPHWHVAVGDKHDPIQEFDTEEEALAALKGEAPVVPVKPVKVRPRVFNQDVPVSVNKIDDANAIPEGRTAITGREATQQNDIQELLFNNSKKSKWEDIEREIKKRYPNQPTKEMKWYYDHYKTGGKLGINWVADQNREAETKGTEDITVSGDTSRLDTAAVTPFGTLTNDDLAYIQNKATEAGQQGFPGLAARELIAATSDLSREEVAAIQRQLREDLAAEGEKFDPSLLAEAGGFGAGMITGAGPEYLIPGAIGESALGRVAGAAAANAIPDAMYQGADIAAGVSDSFSPEQNLLAAGMGSAFQGVLEGLHSFAKEKGSTVEYEVDGTPFVPVETAEGILRVYDPSKPISRKAQLRSSTAQPLPAPEAAPVAIPKNESFKAKENVEATINEVTADWKASPEFTVYDSLDTVPDKERLQLVRDTDGRPEDVKAWTDKDGKVHVIADHLDGPEDISAITFHEALGHVGLARQFGARLDRVLEDAYRSNPNLREEVDTWFKEGGQVPEDVSSPTARATEEVLAENSELGRIDATLFDKVKNILKDYARRAGVKLSYSDREIRTILAMAHSRVINGGAAKKMADGGNKYIRVYHGSAADFDEFDIRKLGTGEGVQAYGHGLYFTETRDIADMYKRKLARPTYTYDGKSFDEWVKTQNPNTHIFNPELWDLQQEYRKAGKPFGRKAAAKAGKPLFVSRPILSDFDTNNIRAALENGWVDTASLLRDISDLKNRLEETQEVSGRKYLEGELARRTAELKVTQAALTAQKAKSSGKLYEVDLPDSMHWLAWDFQPTDAEKVKLKAFGIEYASQAEVRKLYEDFDAAVQKQMDIEDKMNALRDEGKAFETRFLKNPDGSIGMIKPPTPEYSALRAQLRDMETAQLFLQKEMDEAHPHGEVIYDKLVKKLGSPEKASKALKSIGFDGIKYLDGNSRDMGTGSHNYVVFDDKDTKIVNKYVRKKFVRASEPRKQQGSSKKEASPEKKIKNLVNNINLDNLKSTEDISAVMKTIEREIPKTRVSHEEVKAFADANGMTFREVRDWASDNGAARLLTLRQALVRSSERVMKVVRAIDEGDNSDINLTIFAQRMATHRAIQESVSKAISEAGRALNAMKIVAESKKGELDALKYASKASGAEILGSREGLEGLAKTIAQHADDPAAVSRVMKDAFNPLPEDYILSFRYNMMLFGLGTHVKNALGNAGLMYTDLIEHGLASVIGQRKRFSAVPDRISTREVLSRQMGIFQALTEWGTYQEAMKSYKEGKPTHSVSKVEVGQNLFAKKFGAAGSAIEVPTRLLSMSDSFFRSLLEQSSYNGLAHRIAISENLKGQDYIDRIAELTANPTDGMKAMADAHAALTQLVDEPSLLTKKLVEAPKARPKNRKNYGARALRFALHMALPFSRVTDRLFWMAMRRTPIVGFLDRVNREDWAAGGARRDLVIARMALGAAVIGFMTTKFQDGELSGNGPTNYDKKAQMEAEGWQPNSIKFGDTWYSTAGMDSVAPLASLVAHFGDTMKDKDFKDADEVGKVFELMGAGANAFVDNTFAEQIASVFAMVGKGGLAENARENYFTNMEKSFIPAGVRQSAEISDGKIRDATGDGTMSGKLKGGLKTSIPGLREDLPIRHDVYGREIDSNRNIFAVFMSKTESKDPVVNEVKRLSKVNDDKPLVTPSGRKSLESSLKVKKLDASIVQEYQKLAGTYIYESLKENINSPDWKDLTDEEKIKLVKKITTAQRKFAREDLFDGLDSEEGDNDE